MKTLKEVAKLLVLAVAAMMLGAMIAYGVIMNMVEEVQFEARRQTARAERMIACSARSIELADSLSAVYKREIEELSRDVSREKK